MTERKLRQLRTEAQEWLRTDHNGFTLDSLVDLILKFAEPRDNCATEPTEQFFEKEATEYALEWGEKTDGTYACCRDGYLAGAEFGYNKANEWHFVSKEGFPNKDDIYLIIRSDGLHLGDYCCGGDGDIDCQSWCDYPSEEEIQDDSVIAWKEIVFPKESE